MAPVWRCVHGERGAGRPPYLIARHRFGYGVVSSLDLTGPLRSSPPEPGNAPPTAYHPVVLRERCP